MTGGVFACVGLSDEDRNRVRRAAYREGVRLRTDHHRIYRWAYTP